MRVHAARDRRASPTARAATGAAGARRGRRRACRHRRDLFHKGAGHGRAAHRVRGGCARAGAALGQAHGGRQPLRRAHRDGPLRVRRRRPGRALRVGRQHAGHRVRGWPLSDLRGDHRHRRGQLPRPLRARARHSQRPGARLQHRAAGQEWQQVRRAAVHRQGHGRVLLGHPELRREGGQEDAQDGRGHARGPVLLVPGDALRHAGGDY
mmetsp:Transcript_8431/g.34261  ORF Transcript_8431/g.34261 Transcript_8431/m.34261 type:complete len:209 (-) Transcript_8431:326-952(-)